ncbi:hypothetical protein B0H17DRAFT_462099 [Mycena rosella]|uniref:Secreted protein n=1 Tax=Mycena rosella TaxID=1033263 RepID=A0AAD7DNV4_MYCRO|nr:hypothetical protein B0H17DRAFT_462099 [Mycena rosella]
MMPILLPFFFDAPSLLFTLLAHATLSMGAISTATIDDNSVGPVYSPATSFSLNSECATCVVHPDATRAFEGTWHDSSQFEDESPVSVTLSFTGTGIDVFCILANSLTNTERISHFSSMVSIPRNRIRIFPISHPNMYTSRMFSA